MATVEFKPGVATAIFSRLVTESQRRGRIALVPVADAIVKQAKINASGDSHPYGTPTPSPGDPVGPAMISRTLVRSIDRTTPVRISYGWLVQVGMVGGRIPPYSKRASSVYAEILELRGARSGKKYPFMLSAARFGFDIVAPVIYREKYGSSWYRIM